jgi:hypothetical protein
MTPLDFIASLPHGEAKAAALTVYNLMQARPKAEWIEITDDPATLPEKGRTVVIRHVDGYEMFGCLESYWYQSSLASWSKRDQQIEENLLNESETPTHWRLIS